MAKKIIVNSENSASPSQYCEELEKGNILFFPSTPFAFPQEEIEFLLKQRQGGSSARKNIAYKPQSDRITNHESSDPAATEALKQILRNYSERVTLFLTSLLSPYAKGWKHDYASFRPFQEKGRKLRLRARNDLLHVDAFPTRPLHGARILRFFTNINPTESRHWMTSSGFADLAKQFAGQVPIPPSVGYDLKSRLKRTMKKWLSAMKIKIPLRSPYDDFMIRMHNFLKENTEFQEKCPKDHWDFPPGCCWAVFTDQVSHAALSGQYAIEQTFLIPQKVLLNPETSPASVLERMSHRNLIDPELLEKLFPFWTKDLTTDTISAKKEGLHG